MLSKKLAAVATLLASISSAAKVASKDMEQDLGTVLANNKDLSTYYELIQACNMRIKPSSQSMLTGLYRNTLIFSSSFPITQA
jgi:hypothetical protein